MAFAYVSKAPAGVVHGVLCRLRADKQGAYQHEDNANGHQPHPDRVQLETGYGFNALANVLAAVVHAGAGGRFGKSVVRHGKQDLPIISASFPLKPLQHALVAACFQIVGCKIRTISEQRIAPVQTPKKAYHNAPKRVFILQMQKLVQEHLVVDVSVGGKRQNRAKHPAYKGARQVGHFYDPARFDAVYGGEDLNMCDRLGAGRGCAPQGMPQADIRHGVLDH